MQCHINVAFYVLFILKQICMLLDIGLDIGIADATLINVNDISAPATDEQFYEQDKATSISLSYSEEVCEDGCTDDNVDGGWFTDSTSLLAHAGPCSIEVRQADLSQEEFIHKYAYNVPVVIRTGEKNELIRRLSRRDYLLSNHGHRVIRLSSANTYSYTKVDVTLKKYVQEIMRPQSLNQLGNETFYWFGDNNHTEWHELFDVYVPPRYSLPRLTGAFSYGIAAAGTGVPFHFHGPGFGEVLFGAKRWFFYPPDQTPNFHPNRTTLQWLLEDYPKLSASEMPLECTVGPGEVIYFPDHWWHGTLNIYANVFMSTFLG